MRALKQVAVMDGRTVPIEVPGNCMLSAVFVPVAYVGPVAVCTWYADELVFVYGDGQRYEFTVAEGGGQYVLNPSIMNALAVVVFVFDASIGDTVDVCFVNV